LIKQILSIAAPEPASGKPGLVLEVDPRLANAYPEAAALLESAKTAGKLDLRTRPAPEGFARRRRGPTGEVRSGFIPELLVSEAMKAVKASAEVIASERLAGLTDPAERARVSRSLNTLRGLTVEILHTNDILAERVGKTVRVSDGLLTEIYTRSMKLMKAGTINAGQRGMFQLRVLGLILSHEAAHASGIRSERVADAEGLKILKGAKNMTTPKSGVTALEVSETVRLFDAPTGASHIDNLFNRLRSLVRYGTTRGRLENLRRANAGEADRFGRFRRTDGTVRWGEATRAGALREAGGAAQFALALFLKEVAVVAATGDRARIEEFFDALGTTDFYAQYGLFVAGARIGEVAYTRYLQRFVKPTFVNGILKTNLILATGLALPMIVEGRFSGKALALSVSSLGLSTAAVRSGVAGIKWVVNLKTARNTGLLGRVASASKLARVGGWLYTVAELAVILYVAEEVESAVGGYLDDRAAREALGQAGDALVLAAREDPSAVGERARDYHDAWIAYREYQTRSLDADEATLATRLAKLARTAKVNADGRAAAVDRVRKHSALTKSVVARYGSVDAYAAARAKADEDALAASLSTALRSYEASRAEHLRQVYEEGRRGAPLLKDVEHLDWLLGEGSDPYGDASGPFARLGRYRLRANLESALRAPSANRLETYRDEADVLEAVASGLRSRGQANAARAVATVLDGLRRLEAADTQLYRGGGSVEVTTGIADALRSAAD
jgi:hypothetical protein